MIDHVDLINPKRQICLEQHRPGIAVIQIRPVVGEDLIGNIHGVGDIHHHLADKIREGVIGAICREYVDLFAGLQILDHAGLEFADLLGSVIG